ncbi:TonB-dependent receptor [Lutibacter profundi]|uniref:TonB-dependent receptor n=1 Tax=Lutibacter profundi TaxID=1622118 RepID=A0A120IE47_9FLAO|nr:TonB-dependent receptor [Lutibacter profundi]AMC10524.1 TonB-dependent receptor [Lutibacter profundi]
MKTIYKLSVVLLFFSISINAQKDTIKLKEVSITSNRISLPFSKTSRTITLIRANDIIESSAKNIEDLLQTVAGIDVRRRGIDGMQSDLYIRGGNFNQTLVLIDGIKMDDIQTGHHTMNAILPLESIERIEIIKGPAARIYGQNAFTGAINIVTKKITNDALNLSMGYGSYNNKKTITSLSQKFKNGVTFLVLNYQKSDGYRFNTDFENTSVFFKSNFKKYSLITSFTQRKFGANGFYASPNFKNQYEETQTSLVGVSSSYKLKNFILKPKLYWRRNQDMYLFLRENPSYFRNLHISNKIGAETSMVFNSNFGKTGIGIDVSRTFLVSNNLGNHNRTAITGFLEQRFELFNDIVDVTPGFSISYYSDFKTNIFPGIDIGYRISEKFKLYGNIGYTYRVPTFTDMFYIGPTTQGNKNLKPESALSEELGFKYTTTKVQFNVALFKRTSDNLIDWTKENEEDKWETRNFSEVLTQGFETTINYNFKIRKYYQKITMSYSFIEDNIKDNNVQFTRYSLNSIKHQFNSNIHFKLNATLSQNISYKYVERTDGVSYSVVDAKFLVSIKNNIEFSVVANNIFNTIYTETNLVPMPKGNIMFSAKYAIY